MDLRCRFGTTHEDYIPVYNVFVSRLPRSATPGNLSRYFQQFGRVLNVRLLTCKTKGIVKFAKTETAMQVLQHKHIFMDEYLKVEQCHSSNQPGGQRLLKALKRKFCRSVTTKNAINNQKAPIMNLNDDCLQIICQKLSINDQITFALTCERFCDIVVGILKFKYASLNTNLIMNLSLLKLKIFLQIVGPYVKELEINKVRGTIDKFLGSYCRHVEKLYIKCIRISENIMQWLINQMKLVQELKLESVDIEDSSLKYLPKFKNLKSLYISNNNYITDLLVPCGLEKLSLVSCFNFKSKFFKNNCKGLQKLYYLDITGCWIDTKDCEYISNNFLQLETVKLSQTSYNFDCIVKLPNLKSLEVNKFQQDIIVRNFLENLSTYKSNQLEELKLYKTNYITVKITSTLVKFKKLKVLHCSYGDIDEDSWDLFSHLTELEEVVLSECTPLKNNFILNIFEKCLKLKLLDLKKCTKFTECITIVLQLLQKQHDEGLRTDFVNVNISCGFHEIKTYKKSGVAAITIVPNIVAPPIYSSSDDDYDSGRHYYSDSDFDGDLGYWY